MTQPNNVGRWQHPNIREEHRSETLRSYRPCSQKSKFSADTNRLGNGVAPGIILF